MSCGVRYEFSLVPEPKKAKVIVEEMREVGTAHDAQEAAPADPRMSNVTLPPEDRSRGRQSQR